VVKAEHAVYNKIFKNIQLGQRRKLSCSRDHSEIGGSVTKGCRWSLRDPGDPTGFPDSKIQNC